MLLAILWCLILGFVVFLGLRWDLFVYVVGWLLTSSLLMVGYGLYVVVAGLVFYFCNSVVSAI